MKVSLVSGKTWRKSNVLSLLLSTNLEFRSQCFLFQTHLFNQDLYYLSLRNPHQSELAFSLPSVKLMEYLLPSTSWPGAQLDARYTKIPRSPSQSWQSSPGPPHSPRFYSPTPALTKAAPSLPPLPPQLLPSLATCWVILYNLINNRSPFLFSLSPTTLRSGSFRNKLPHCYQTSPNPGNPISLSSLSTPIWGLTLRFHLVLNLKAGNLWELNPQRVRATESQVKLRHPGSGQDGPQAHAWKLSPPFPCRSPGAANPKGLWSAAQFNRAWKPDPRATQHVP